MTLNFNPPCPPLIIHVTVKCKERRSWLVGWHSCFVFWRFRVKISVSS